MADLTVTVTDSITVSGRRLGSEREHTITGINNTLQALIDIPDAASFTAIGFLPAAAGVNSLADGTLRYARFTNTDGTNPVFLFFGTASAGQNIEIPAGCSFILTEDKFGTAASFVSSLTQMDKISARATGGDVIMEVFYATT